MGKVRLCLMMGWTSITVVIYQYQPTYFHTQLHQKLLKNFTFKKVFWAKHYWGTFFERILTIYNHWLLLESLIDSLTTRRRKSPKTSNFSFKKVEHFSITIYEIEVPAGSPDLAPLDFFCSSKSNLTSMLEKSFKFDDPFQRYLVKKRRFCGVETLFSFIKLCSPPSIRHFPRLSIPLFNPGHIRRRQTERFHALRIARYRRGAQRRRAYSDVIFVDFQRFSDTRLALPPRRIGTKLRGWRRRRDTDKKIDEQVGRLMKLSRTDGPHRIKDQKECRCRTEIESGNKVRECSSVERWHRGFKII